jgi:arginine decarboxylase
VQGLSASQKAGVRIAYATDPTLAKYRVVVK